MSGSKGNELYHSVKNIFELTCAYFTESKSVTKKSYFFFRKGIQQCHS